MSRDLRKLFDQARREKRVLFLPYVCVGYPSFPMSLKIAEAALRAGADGLELGVPFSDPIADGPTLQRATHTSLVRGTRVTDAFRLVRLLRNKGHRQPLLIMTYVNPIEQAGWKRFAGSLSAAGGDGVIVPDLPIELSRKPGALLKSMDLALIPFVSPTSDKRRVSLADSLHAPFLYYVSVTGVTGARRNLGRGLLPRLKALERRIKTPVVVGFGISNALQARRVGRAAGGGVIIASALINLIERTPAGRVPAVVEKFCRGIVNALRHK